MIRLNKKGPNPIQNGPCQSERYSILVLAEGATLAHPTRSAYLAQLLARDGFEVVFGTSRDYLAQIGPIPGVQRIEIASPPTTEILHRLNVGRFSHTTEELESQLSENLRLLEGLKPTCAIGDMRITLPMAGRLAHIPCLTVVNHHWSPYVHSRYPIPDSAPVRLFGTKVSGLFSRFVTPILLRRAIQPLNGFRVRHGFAEYRSMREAFCDGDRVLYVGLPRKLQSDFPKHHTVVGPLCWNGGSGHESISKLSVRKDQGVIYVAMGSSGNQSLVPRIIRSLADFPGTLLISHPHPQAIERLGSAKIIAKTFIPIGDALEVSDLMIGNGGTATVLASLVAGKPYFALYSNLDQALSIEQYRSTGAVDGGLSIQMTHEKLRRSLERLLNSGAATRAARSCQAEFEELGGEAWTLHQLRGALHRLEPLGGNPCRSFPV